MLSGPGFGETWLQLHDQHCVAVAEEPVAFLNGRPVSMLSEFRPHQRAYEHKQCRLWQMEIRQQTVDGTEFIRRPNKEIRLSGVLLN